MATFTFNDEDEFDVISLCLEGEEEEDCLILGIFDTREYDYEYIALMPVRCVEEEDEECLLYLYRYEEDGEDEVSLTQIEDEKEFLVVQETFDRLFGDEE